MPFRFAAVWVLAAGAVLIAPARVSASDLNYSLVLQATGQNMWGGGSSNVLDTTYFSGHVWDTSDVTGGIGDTCFDVGFDTVCTGKTGTEKTGYSNGTAGLRFNVHSDSGTVNAGVPASVDLKLAGDGTRGSPYSVTPTVTLQPGAFLNTTFANASLSGNLMLDLHASVKVEVCAFGACDSGSTGELLPGFNNLDISLFSYNDNDNNKLKAFGVNVPVFQFNNTINLPLVGSKLGDIRINNPDFETTGEAGTMQLPVPCQIFDPEPFCTQTISGLEADGGVSDLLSVHADVLNMALEEEGASLSASVAIPDCPLPLCTVGLDFGEINEGVTLGLSQTNFVQDPSMATTEVDLLVKETGQVIRDQPGRPVNITIPDGYSQLHIVPMISTSSMYYSTTYLTVAQDLDINFLKACIAGECLGPVEQYCPADEPGTDCKVPLPSHEASFAIDTEQHPLIMTAFGDEFVIGTADAAAETPETGGWLPGAIGLGLIGMRRVFGIGLRRRGKRLGE